MNYLVQLNHSLIQLKKVCRSYLLYIILCLRSIPVNNRSFKIISFAPSLWKTYYTYYIIVIPHNNIKCSSFRYLQKIYIYIIDTSFIRSIIVNRYSLMESVTILQWNRLRLWYVRTSICEGSFARWITQKLLKH